MTEREKGGRWPGETDEVHPTPFVTPPSPDTSPSKPGQLPREQILKFFEEGYIVVRDFFRPEELEPCRLAIQAMVHALAVQLHRAGKISRLYEELDLFRRLTALEEEFPGANILLFKNQKLPKAFMELWTNERLLNVVEQLIGPDIAGHPVWNLRTKTPNSPITVIPWHQDSAYFDNKSYDHLIPTAWIPFLDATQENGCLQMVKFAHRLGKVARHTCCAGPSWYVDLDEQEMVDTLGVDLEKDAPMEPVPYGGFILFHNLTPHRSLLNVSSAVRWSVDLRWQSPHFDWGFYGIQSGVLFRSAGRDVTPDWNSFLAVDRKQVWQRRYQKNVASSDELDTTITGPWIGKWQMVNHNRHTAAFRDITQS